MSVFEKGFIDHEVEVNRKRIEVVEKEEYANGTVALIANVNRNDIGVSVEGTKLNAKSMNSAVLDLVYYELYGLYSDIEGYNVESDLTDVEKYYVRFTDRRFYGYAVPNDYLDISVSNEVDKFRIIIEKKLNVTLDTAMNIPFYIDLYADSDVNFFVCRYKGNISYVPSSTSAND